MPRLVRFALGGVVTLWLIGLLPPSWSTVALALVVGVGVAGGRVAGRLPEIVALAVGAFMGTLAAAVTPGIGTVGRDGGEILTGALTIAIVVAIAAALSRLVEASRQAAPRRGR
jgi:hypothetical protein